MVLEINSTTILYNKNNELPTISLHKLRMFPPKFKFFHTLSFCRTVSINLCYYDLKSNGLEHARWSTILNKCIDQQNSKLFNQRPMLWTVSLTYAVLESL